MIGAGNVGGGTVSLGCGADNAIVADGLVAASADDETTPEQPESKIGTLTKHNNRAKLMFRDLVFAVITTPVTVVFFSHQMVDSPCVNPFFGACSRGGGLPRDVGCSDEPST